MKRSKKGTWIVDDDQYKYVVELNNLEILPIKMYRVNFNRVTVMIPKSANKPDGLLKSMRTLKFNVKGSANLYKCILSSAVV